MRKTSRVYASSYCDEVAPDLEHLEGGFVHHTGKTRMTGCMEGQAIAIGKLIAELMSNEHWSSFEDRMEYANLIMQIVDAMDESGQIRRVLHLATREK